MAVIQVYEHQVIRVGQFPAFEQSHYDALCHFFEQQSSNYFSIVHHGVRFSHYVGVLQVGNLTIEILPKISQYSELAATDWQKILLEMLRACRLLKVESHSTSNLSLRSNAILDLYFEMFIDEVEQLFRQGLIRQYSRKRGRIDSLKGRLLMQQQLQKQQARVGHFYTEHDIYDYAHLFNQMIREALKLIQTIPLSGKLNARLRKLMGMFPEMPSLDTRAINKAYTFVFDRRTARYKNAIEIARLLLLNYHPMLHRGPHSTLALLFDMNLLFEEFVFRSLLPLQKESLIIARQQTRPFWGRRFIRPDILIEQPDDRLVLDTKWKTPGSGGPSMNDLRQLLVYARQFGAKRGVIIYPRSHAEQESYIQPFAQPERYTDKIEGQVIFVDLVSKNRLNKNIGTELLQILT